MPSYSYRAVHATGRITRGDAAAANENELAHYLRESGLELIAARVRGEKNGWLPQGRGAPPRALASFCARMQGLLQSGLPFLEALREAAGAADNRVLSGALAHVARAIENGGGVAASFALYPRLFSEVFVAGVSAGERSGKMTEVFAFLSRWAELRAQTQERMRRALRYPLFLLLVAGSAMTFMLCTVVPEVVQFIAGIDAKLPLATRLLLRLSGFVAAYVWAIAAALAALAALLWLTRRLSAGFALRLDALMLRLPVIGPVARKTALARFMHGFSILFKSGCDAPQCLREAGNTLTNRALRAGIASAGERLENGAALSQALEGVMPPFALGLLRTGEKSADIGRSLDDIAAAYDREAQAATDNFIALLEPALTLLIGGMLAWTVMAVLGPLYGSLSVLGSRM